ncbi:MAG: FixH family protein [Acidimicrobiales bacterium]|nr:FixH family protein [Acidimicrobiales bacterium]
MIVPDSIVRRSTLGALLAFLLSAVSALWLLHEPVSAHEGPGTITVVDAQPVGANANRYTVELLWADGHPADDATITAVAEGPGQKVGPVTMTASAPNGRYEAVITFPAPGEWTVRFTSVTPLASLAYPQTVATSETRPAPSEQVSSTAGTTAPVPPEVALSTQPSTPAVGTRVSTGSTSPSSPSSNPLGWIVLIAVTLTVAITAAVVVARRRTPDRG